MMKISNLRKFALVSTALIAVLGFADIASASTFAQTHARRAEVNHRLNHQSQRIASAEASGAISPAKAARLHRQDRRIRREERMMASLNHGHISRAERRALNQQENKVSHKIP